MMLGESTCKLSPIFLREKTTDYVACDKALAARSLSVIEFDYFFAVHNTVAFAIVSRSSFVIAQTFSFSTANTLVALTLTVTIGLLLLLL